jgi:hypothetical protein
LFENGVVILKFGRHEININGDNLIFDNGACFQIITREAGNGWNLSFSIISKICLKAENGMISFHFLRKILILKNFYLPAVPAYKSI